MPHPVVKTRFLKILVMSFRRYLDIRLGISGVDLTWDPTSDASMWHGMRLIGCIPLE